MRGGSYAGALPPLVKVTSKQKDYGRDHDGSPCTSTAHAGPRQNDDQDAGKDCNEPMFFMAVIHNAANQ